MRRSVALLVGIFGSLNLVTMAAAFPPVTDGMPVLVSGQEVIALIDANGNGPDPADCRFMASLHGEVLTIMTHQDAGSPMLEACEYSDFYGLATKSFNKMSNFGDVIIRGAMGPMGTPGSLPLMAMWVDETPNPSATAPLRFDSPNDKISITFPQPNGTDGSGALFCNAGGPAARVDIAGAPSMLWPLSFIDKGGIRYLCIPNLPLRAYQVGVGWINGLYNAYIPATADNRITATSDTALLGEIDFDTLPGCAVAPAASVWGLIAVVLTLLAIGTWTLSRRPGFARSLGSF